MGSQKLCKDRHNFTVTIDDKLYHSQSGYRDYLVNYQNSESFTGFGMLVKIEGKFYVALYEVRLGDHVCSMLLVDFMLPAYRLLVYCLLTAHHSMKTHRDFFHDSETSSSLEKGQKIQKR